MDMTGRRLLDQHGQPIPPPEDETVEVDIRSLMLIDRAALPGMPVTMEGRLLAPWVVLYHPFTEMSLRVPLTELGDLPRYVEMLNIAVLKHAMGETPEEEGYRIDGS